MIADDSNDHSEADDEDNGEDPSSSDDIIVDQYFYFDQKETGGASPHRSEQIDETAEHIYPELREAMRNFYEDHFEFRHRMEDAYSDSFASLDADHDRLLRETIDKTYFDQIFIPSLGLHFERLCYMLVNCISAPCGLCSLRVGKSRLVDESGADARMDRWQSVACPHLVSSEWSSLLKLRLVGRQFWRAFLASEIGSKLVLYVVMCESCDYTNMMVGSSEKQHDQCNLLAELERRKRVAHVCQFGDERLAETQCSCRKRKLVLLRETRERRVLARQMVGDGPKKAEQ